ncbi:MAG: hypothetical protein ABUS49_11490 [Acidobacteriota bacterium]
MNSGIDRRTLLAGWFPALFHKSTAQLSGVPFRVMSYGHSPRRFIVIHGNEDTARDVLSAWMFDHEGVAYIVTGSDRNVDVHGVKIDPNRMFSRVGAERSILSLNPGVAPDRVTAALDYLDKERGKALRRLIPPKGSRLFALHNNRDYSVQDEIAASDQTSIKQPDTPRDFFLCTSPADYDVLKQSPFNVVLQTRPEPDDGSLSRLAARRGFRYINLECALGDYEGQRQRVQWLEDRLP